MDQTDREIVRLLRSEGRLSQEQVTRAVHLSRPAVHERIKRLEADGVIRGYSADVDWDAIGLPLTAFIWVRTTLACLPLGRAILALASESVVVEECHRVTGEWCLLVKVRSASSLALQNILDDIRALPGVQNTMTTVTLSEIRPEGSVEEACGIEPGDRQRERNRGKL